MKNKNYSYLPFGGGERDAVLRDAMEGGGSGQQMSRAGDSPYVHGVNTSRQGLAEGKVFDPNFASIPFEYDINSTPFQNQQEYGGAILSKIDNLLRGKKEWRKRYKLPKFLDRGSRLSERDQAIADNLLNEIHTRIDPSKADEFSSKLSSFEKAYMDPNPEMYYDKMREMSKFLDKALISPMKPVKPRRIEDKVMDGFIEADNKYNMGE